MTRRPWTNTEPTRLADALREIERLRAEVEALRAKVAALRPNAERYQWLREQDWNRSLLACVSDPKQAVKLGHDCPSRGRLDQMVDALRGEVE